MLEWRKPRQKPSPQVGQAFRPKDHLKRVKKLLYPIGESLSWVVFQLFKPPIRGIFTAF